MELTELPVTIIIKAPNQRIGDHTVECMLGWTVKKLKNHLAEVYPSKPKEVHQRLIYSGKLLQDHLLLKDVIRQDNEQSYHTVHLVCSQQESQETVHVAPQSVSTASPTVTTMPNTDSLRYRGTTPNNYHGGIPNTTSPVDQPQMMPPQTGMTQEQYMVMMQTYYNQMAAQYMQYYQTGVFPNMANIQIAAPDTMLQNPQQIQPNNIPNRQDDNQNVILDARGRVVENVDNDDELGQHDWLDYIYTFSRFMVLISIVYFYSNFTRFAIVALFFFIAYLYQTGFFRVRRRETVRPQQPEPVQEQPPQQQQQQENIQPEQQPQEENIETEETVPPEPPKPSVLSIVWSFFTTFFSSLIPQPPPALNGN